MPQTPALEFWFEFASTYSYIAVCEIADKCAHAGVALVWRPFLLGPVFAAQGWTDSPFNIYPAKGFYMWRDMERLCAARGLPWRKPSQFPRNGVLAARIATALEDRGMTGDFTRAVFHTNFVGDCDIADPDVLTALLRELGLDADATLTQARSEPVKARLRVRTEDAAARGVFGAPSFFVGEELFWGSDRLDQAIDWALHTPRG